MLSSDNRGASERWDKMRSEQLTAMLVAKRARAALAYSLASAKYAFAGEFRYVAVRLIREEVFVKALCDGEWCKIDIATVIDVR